MTLRELLDKARGMTTREQMDAADALGELLDDHAEDIIALWEAACRIPMQASPVHAHLAVDGAEELRAAVERLRPLMEGNNVMPTADDGVNAT
jgi:hypothetical protein